LKAKEDAKPRSFITQSDFNKTQWVIGGR